MLSKQGRKQLSEQLDHHLRRHDGQSSAQGGNKGRHVPIGQRQGLRQADMQPFLYSYGSIWVGPEQGR